MSSVIATDVVVDFPVYGTRHRSFKSTVPRAATGGSLAQAGNDRVVVRALDGLTFNFQQGDRVGLLGHNGSGKSTLLRVVAGAYEPVSGNISVQGNIISMLSTTLGLDYEATGYENIFLLGAVRGRRATPLDTAAPHPRPTCAPPRRPAPAPPAHSRSPPAPRRRTGSG